MRCLNCGQKGIPLSVEICPRCGVHLPSLMRDVLPHGTLLQSGTYRIEYALGRGGFGITYQATHTALEQLVAIKEFYPQEHAIRESTTGVLIIPTTKQEVYKHGIGRFLREGKILAKLNHPNIVQVRDFFEQRGTAYLVMELITGSTLREELNAQPEKRLAPARVETLMDALVNAVTAVHQQGIYHLDIKPDNILLTPEGRLVLVDFGASRQGLGTKSTQAFTLDYAPAEVIAGGKVGAESDLFELGMMLHEMLTGKLPPKALDRLLEDTNWYPHELGEPWLSLVRNAVQLRKEQRPKSVLQWWQQRLASSSSITFNISPFGKVEVTEVLHEGQSFNVYRAQLYNQDVVLKTPSPNLTGHDFYNGEYSDDFTSRLFIGQIEHGINASVDKQDWQLNHVQLPTGILLAEAQVINWTAGAWNHHIIGMGTWDGLSNCHFSKDDWWYEEEPLHLRFYPVLIMPYYRAVPFASLPNSLKRKLFPKMLPALWDALCEVHHGDLSESNILISHNYDKFYIIDPGILLTSPVSGDRHTTNICVFTTTPANYPILPPFWDLQLEGGTFNSYGLVEYIKQLSNQVLSDNNLLFTQSSRIPDNSLSRLQPKNRPSLPDLLAIGIIYYRILTNQEIFLGRSILPEKPAWQYRFGIFSQELYETYNHLADSLSQKYIEKELNKFNITQAEKLLVSALLNLEINHKEHLRSLSC